MWTQQVISSGSEVLSKFKSIRGDFRQGGHTIRSYQRWTCTVHKMLFEPRPMNLPPQMLDSIRSMAKKLVCLCPLSVVRGYDRCSTSILLRSLVKHSPEFAHLSLADALY